MIKPMIKRPRFNERRNPRQAQDFWNNEYNDESHLALSTKPSEDLIKFCLWQERQFGKKFLNPIMSCLDVGTGNGRNLIYLSENYKMRGLGFDISKTAIDQASDRAEDLPIKFIVGNIKEPLPVADQSQTLVLDLMTSHFLNQSEREDYITEINRVLKPGGWFLWKTFFLDEDKHAERLIRDHFAGEKNSYIHPQIGVLEHVFTVAEIEELLAENFVIHKIIKSQKHRGEDGMRRSIVIYAEKITS
jgi:ubiquinone/menaquinone biosynthesis C-methylase UbiE